MWYVPCIWHNKNAITEIIQRDCAASSIQSFDYVLSATSPYVFHLPIPPLLSTLSFCTFWHISCDIWLHRRRNLEKSWSTRYARQKGVALLTLCWFSWLSVKTFAVKPSRGCLREGERGEKSPLCLEICTEIRVVCRIRNMLHLHTFSLYLSLSSLSLSLFLSAVNHLTPLEWAKLKCVKMRYNFRFDFVNYFRGTFLVLFLFSLFLALFLLASSSACVVVVAFIIVAF